MCKPAVMQAQTKHSAAHSHVRNDQYMDDWEKAYAELQALNCGDSSGHEGPAPVQSQRKGLSLAQQIAQQGSRSQQEPAPPRAHNSNLAKQLGQQHASPYHHQSGRTPARSAGQTPERCPPAVTQGWSQGPVDPQACWNKNEVVIGSSDHALYIVDAEKGTHKRTLYNKTNGHTEWVTCCTYTGAGEDANMGYAHG
eukprot:1155917-Pelagomonas_calceolata.AAC.2